MESRTALVLAVFSLVLVAGLCAPARADDADERVLREYEDGLRMNALSKRTQARQLFATRHPNAFEILTESYGDPEAPEVQVRSLITNVVTGHFTQERWLDGYTSWRKRYRKREDAWLWYRSLCVLAPVGGPLATYEEGLRRDAFLRAAAIEAAAVGGDHTARVAVLEAVLDDLPAKGLERGVVLGCASALALSLSANLADTPVRDAVRRLIKEVDAKATPDWARLAIARHVAALPDMPPVTLDVPVMLAALENRALPAPETRYARPRFMGLEATGQRVCYVIDLSNSMLEPLTGRELEDLRRPVTGARPAPAAEVEEPASPESRIPWARVKTRFDAAREFLKISLEDLADDQSFAIVTIGTSAEFFAGFGQMKRATEARARRACRALDAIKPSPPSYEFPKGRLNGETNLHGALRLAFAIGNHGSPPAYVNPAGFDKGCDTIFLLSDGAPTEDDWPGVDAGQGGGSGTRKSEGGVPVPSSGGGMGSVRYSGPYSNGGAHLREDVRRLNVFRKVEIHCIGLGRAHMGLLKHLAGLGLGEAKSVGKGPRK